MTATILHYIRKIHHTNYSDPIRNSSHTLLQYSLPTNSSISMPNKSNNIKIHKERLSILVINADLIISDDVYIVQVSTTEH